MPEQVKEGRMVLLVVGVLKELKRPLKFEL